jgi:hypothetical protein
MQANDLENRLVKITKKMIEAGVYSLKRRCFGEPAEKIVEEILFDALATIQDFENS